MYIGASPIIAPPQPALSPPQKRPAAQPSTARPQSRKSPKILQILLQTIRPFPRRKKDPPPNHQSRKSPKILQILLRLAIRRPKIPQNPANPASDNPPFPRRQTRRPTINRSPAILEIPQNPANLLQTTSTPNLGPLLSFQLDPLSLI